jgi:hypothetical protein
MCLDNHLLQIQTYYYKANKTKETLLNVVVGWITFLLRIRLENLLS